MRTHDILLSAIIIVFFQPSTASWQPPKKVLLRDTTALTFKDGAYTAGRRSKPRSQIQCVGGDACNKVNIPVIQCRNVGWDGDVQWQCQAEMEDLYKFGTTEVSCEGFDYQDDPYVLKDSCSVEYTLYYTEKGRRLRKHERQSSSWFGSGPSSQPSHYDTVPSSSSKLAKLVWLAVGAIMVYSFWRSWFSPSARARSSPSSSSAPNRNNFSSNGSDSDSGNNHSGGSGGGFFGGFSPNSDSSCRRPSSSSSGSTQPGFWTGLATGGILGHLLSPNSSSRRQAAHPTFMNTGSSFFGDSGFSSSPARGFSNAGSSSSNSPPRTHTSTGYGGTKRR
ncbi:hypothetical protein SeMB42_g04767 [Synchytrium endobioticum]|uniref:Store-operated calcium entry-associated regulatory factor n=1 Tax=Synchytrium endobioticum TaxID=286115 RepID=A0A507CVQ4_9FUNG|nr:hypothetical protein SeMB42_g04767 [Synchytrium endobioticum]TPX46182.1 hypothetical protein SeLEV6574_g03355 [Synchytrium endobioticum]